MSEAARRNADSPKIAALPLERPHGARSTPGRALCYPRLADAAGKEARPGELIMIIDN